MHSRRAVERARRDALRRLAETTHWLTIKQAAALVPCDPMTLRRWLARHTPCDTCPIYRARGTRRPAWRVLSPRDVHAARTALLMRRHH